MLLTEFNWKREVLDAPGPVLADFRAEWCGPCRAMNPVLAALARDYTVCKVNIDTNPKLAAKYDVQVVPTLIVFRNGQPVQRIEGAAPEAALRAALS